jgi:glycosyltransferase involved in cell wall biosynthesis
MGTPEKQKPRIFVGVSETTDICRMTARGLKELGFPVTISLSEFNIPHLERPGDDHRVIKFGNRFGHQFRLFKEFVWAWRRHDIFIFRGGSFTGSFVKSWAMRWLSYSDVFLLRLFGKRVVFMTVGSDIRNPTLLADDLRQRGQQEIADAIEDTFTGDDYLKHSKHRAKKIERNSDLVFANPNYAYNLTREYGMWWVPIDLDTVKFSVQNNERPIVVHAPSNSLIKGTSHVLAAVEVLRAEGLEFEFKLIQGKSNSEVLDILSEADIALDQFYLPSYGSFAVEAMASGCALMGLPVPDIDTQLAESPVVPTHPSKIVDNLRELITNSAERIRLAHAGHDWVEKNHDYRVVATRYAKYMGIL